MVTLRARPVFSDSTVHVFAVESCEIARRRSAGGYQLFGTADPVAVVVCDPDSVYALDMAAKPINLEQLREAVPALDSIIAASSTSQLDS
jgi:hypothetical protein